MNINRFRYVLSVDLLLMSIMVMGQTISMENPYTPQKFYHFIVDNSAEVAHSFIGVADLNNDDQTDILAFEGGINGYLSWYVYPGFQQHFISHGDFHEERPIAADIDNDGDMDVFVYKEGACWYENPLPEGDVFSLWPEHFCGEAELRVKDYGSGDFDRDERLDLVFIGYNNTFIFFQDGHDAWTKHSFSYENGHEGGAVGDLDHDGDPDIVHNGRWFETPDNARTGNYTEHNIDAKWYNDQLTWRKFSTMVQLADIDGNNRLDVVISHSESPGYPISWYSAEDPEGIWVEHIIDADFGWCQTLKAGDMDGDGDVDLLAGRFQRSPIEKGKPNSLPSDPPFDIRIYYNPGETGKEWSKQVIANTGIYNGQLADVGNDGDLDIIGIRGYWTGPIEIWENRTHEDKLSLKDWQYIEVDDSRDRYTIPGGRPNWKYFGLAMGDLDHDGFADIVSGEWFYKNPGGNMSGDWKRINFPIEVDASLVVDVDGDEFGDVIGQRLPEIYWLEAVNKKCTRWQATKIGNLESGSHGNSELYSVGTLIPKGHPDIGVLPVRKPEILIGAGSRSKVAIIQIPDDPEQEEWINQIIIDQKGGYAIGDIDRDGFDDIAGSYGVESQLELVPGTNSLVWENSRIAWWMNPGTSGDEWVRFTVGVGTGPDRYGVADLNGDNRLDIIISEERYWGMEPNATLSWYEQPADPAYEHWKRHRIVTQYSMNSMDVADMDQDGDMDIIVCEHSNPPKDTPPPAEERLQIWENDGTGKFSEQLVDTGKESHLGARVFDLDGDGDLDIISIGWREYQYLHVWRNDAINIWKY